MDALDRRIRRVEDRLEIQELGVRYGYLVDEANLEGVKRLFTDDATIRTKRGQSKGAGVDGIAEHFAGRFAVLGPTNHFVHGHLIDFDDTDEDRATGIVFSHAEVSRDGRPMLAALRYHDTYRRIADGWRFADRLQAFMYYVDVREYAETVGADLRIRLAGAAAQPADWPERFSR